MKSHINQIHKEVDIPIAITLTKMGVRGLAIDIDELLRLEHYHNKEMKQALKDCKAVGIWANPNSPKQITENLLELGCDTGSWGKKNAKGERLMSAGQNELIDLIEEDSYARLYVDPIIRYRKSKKFKSQYIKGIARNTFKDKRGTYILRGSFLWPGTSTWRPVCRAPNLLNLPRTGFRSCVISRYDKGCIVKADYGQLELRVLASLSKDPIMLKIYRDRLDIHDTTATQFYGSSYTKDERSRAKNINFGMIYGASPNRIRSELRKDGVAMTQEEAEEWVSVWRATYKKAWWFMGELQKKARKYWKVYSPNYEIVRKFDLLSGKRDDEVAREGANMPIQSGASMMTLRAGNKFENRSKESSYDHGIMVNLPYDELVVDAPDDGHWAAETMVNCMKEAADEEPWFIVPAEVDAEIGPNWGNTKGFNND